MDFLHTLHQFASRGYRVLALASRTIYVDETPGSSNWVNAVSEIVNAHRDMLEHELEFRALLLLENKLKSDSPNVISTLTRAAIRPVMVTGTSTFKLEAISFGDMLVM